MINTWHLILGEIRHRKFHFGLAVLGVMTAVACSTSVIVLLVVYDMQTKQILWDQRQVVQKRNEELDFAERSKPERTLFQQLCFKVYARIICLKVS